MSKPLDFDKLTPFLADLVGEMEKTVPYAAAFAQRRAGNRVSSSTHGDAIRADTPSTGVALTAFNGERFLEFRFLELSSGTTRLLARLDDRGDVHAFDVTPDGQALVFDRVQQHADVVLIER